MQTLFVNARIWTASDASPWAQAMLCEDARILAIGSLEDVAASAARDAARVDLEGCLVVPGFNDSHMHLLGYGLTLQEADLSPRAGVTSIPLLVDALRIWAADHRDREWVVGNGYYQEALEERRHPTAAELDAAFTDRPVVLFHASGHALVANTAALRSAGIGPHTPDPPGGEIQRYASGSPTGLLLEAATGLVERVIPPPGPRQMQDAIRAAAAALASRGLTAASDMSVGWFNLEEEIAAYRQAALQGLPVRITLSPLATRFGSPQQIPQRSEFAASVGLSDDRASLRLGPLKLFADGAITTRTAAVREPFTNGASGILTHSPEELENYIQSAIRKGWQLAVHAIGDRAIDLVLTCLEKAQNTGKLAARRPRIEHCMMPDTSLVARIAALGAVPALQMEFLARLGDAYVAALGLERAERLNPAASLLKAGIPVAFGSDCPVVPGHPLDGIRAAVERTAPSGVVLGSSECITPQSALLCYTQGSAYATFDETSVGCLAPGLRADATLLQGTATLDAIQHACVVGTIFGGEIAWSEAPHASSGGGTL